MRLPGIVGGIAPESTVDYYRKILAGFQLQRPGDPAPHLIINSISAKILLDLAGRADRGGLVEYLLAALSVLSRAGADFGVFASNTPHLVFDQLRERSALPLISIVEATREAAVRMGLRRLALFGTQFTMQASFYSESFAAAGLEIVRPNAAEQRLIHAKYMAELVPGRFLPETRSQLMDVIKAMTARENVDAVILGGTELPLLFGDTGDSLVPLLDTATFHTQAVVDYMLEPHEPVRA